MITKTNNLICKYCNKNLNYSATAYSQTSTEKEKSKHSRTCKLGADSGSLFGPKQNGPNKILKWKLRGKRNLRLLTELIAGYGP